jgi:hypothetical protein
MSTRQKVRNWSVCNKSLIKRGGIIFNFNQNYLSHLYYRAKQVRGGAKQYSDSNVNDCEAVSIMSQCINGKVASVRADGAYDTEAFRKIITDWGGVAIIPLASTSKSQDELQKKPKYKKYYLEERDREY